MSKRTLSILSVLLIIAALASACAPFSQTPSSATPTPAAEQAPKSCTYSGVEYLPGKFIQVSNSVFMQCDGKTGSFFSVDAVPTGQMYYDVRADKSFDMNDCKAKVGFTLMEDSATLGYCAYAQVVANPTPAPAVPVTSTQTVTPTAEVYVTCTAPFIKAGNLGDDINSLQDYGEKLDTTLGKRETFTARRFLVPDKSWDTPLTKVELTKVETTTLQMQVCVPQGMYGTIFAGGFEQGLNFNQNGVFMTLYPGRYTFQSRNGEVVLWYPDQTTYSTADFNRITTQIRTGNFDIHSPLSFFGVTADLISRIPADLVKDKKMQIMLDPVPDLVQ